MNAPERILVTRLKSLGDVVFTLPAVNALRGNFPAARISFLVSAENAPLIEGFRGVDRTLVLDRREFRGGNPVAIVRATWSLLREFRRERFGLAVDLQGYGETALLTWCTRAPRRWGVVYQPARAWAYTHPLRLRPGGVHPADFYLSLLEKCGLGAGRISNEFVLPDPAQAEADRFLASEKVDRSRPLIFIQPFTSTPKKNWPLERYLVLAQEWSGRGLGVLFGGGPGDREALAPVRAAGFPVSAGVPLLVTAGLMNRCALVVGGDTGMPHLAMALGKRVVMIMVSARPGTTHPFHHADWAVVPPASRNIGDVSIDSVASECRKAFQELGIAI
ncbi:MAG: glycosyltransferase family 9 protein [Verrucomicrobiota bacterium]